MHTAQQLESSMFEVRVNGLPATREDILPAWGPEDRLGIAVHSPFGGVGAANLIQLAITAFFDVRPERRDRDNPTYPEFFLFHVGGYWGDYSWFDFFPPRKEVEVSGDARDVLGAINDRGITRLLVPDGAPAHVDHYFKEPASALDRIVSAFAYSGTGRVRESDVSIIGAGARAEANARITLHPERWPPNKLANQRGGPERDRERRKQLLEGISGFLPEVRAQRASLATEAGGCLESYRRIPAEAALRMLGPQPR